MPAGAGAEGLLVLLEEGEHERYGVGQLAAQIIRLEVAVGVMLS